ncbi:HEAT repeat domain-containing protein [bacterium]|nr:HEAT repeat domain-containing protein [bacterium]
MKKIILFQLFVLLLVTGCSSSSDEKYINGLKSNNVTVRQNAIYNLGKDRVSKAVPILLQLLKDEQSKAVRLSIIEALAEINKISFAETLINRLYTKENASEIQIAISVKALIDRLNENDREIQIAAIEALGKIKAAEAVLPLVNLLNIDDRSIKLTAFRALGNIKDDAAVPALTMLLDNHDQYIRYNAAQALKKIGNSE